MSDSEDMREVNDQDREETQAEKKRRVQRACDLCRKKKVKCDGASKDNGICTNCATFSFDCTYVEVAKKRGPPKGYVESVENRLERMEKLLTRLSPGSDFTAELGAKIADRDSFDLEAHRQFEPPGATPIRTRNTGSYSGGGSSSTANGTRHSSPAVSCSTSEIMKPWNKDAHRADSGEYDEPEVDEIEVSLMKTLETFTLTNEEEDKKGFVGKSSGLHLIESIRDFKYPEHSASSKDAFIQSLSATRRRKYWRVPPWEDLIFNTTSSSSPSLWPPPDLIQPLLNSYFLNTNTFHPLLHRPTFEHEFSSRLYETNRSFAGLCLCVFALGARYMNDPRVCGMVADEELRPYAKGWCFVQEFFNIQKSWGDLHHLHGIQALALASLFVGGCSDPTMHWTLVGSALRACLDLGLHRRHIVRAKEPADAELHKRVFWVLYNLDRGMAGMLGRPVGIHDEDIDVDYPNDVDDEFWVCEDPTMNMKQPPNKPSQIAAFIAHIKLQQIAGYCLRTIYAINKSKMMLNFNTVEAQQHIVAELDSGLNAWLDMVPKHLKWDPHSRDNLWFQQSANLYSSYYSIQILVHRPFIPSGPTKPSAIGFPSLAICTNAARSGTHVIDVARHRDNFLGLEWAMVQQSFMFGVVLLINVWGGKKSGSIGDPDMALKDVSKIQALHSSAEERWLVAGKLKDIIGELASQTNAPIPSSRSHDPSHKRSRDGTNVDSDSQPSKPPVTVTRKKSTTLRKTSVGGRASSVASESRPPSVHSIHQYSPSGAPSPQHSARGSITSIDRDIMAEPSASQVPMTPQFYPSNGLAPPGQFGSPGQPEASTGHSSAFSPNLYAGLGLPMSAPPAALPNPTNMPGPSVNPYANYFPPTNNPATLAQQAQFFAFLQAQNGGAPAPPAPYPMPQQQPQQQHGQLPFPHMPQQSARFPPQQLYQQQPPPQQFQQQQQRPSPAGGGYYGGEPTNQGQGFDMSFFNPQLAMFGGPSPPSSHPPQPSANARPNGAGGGGGAEEQSAWAGAPNGFEIDDWSSYLATFTAGSPAASNGPQQQQQGRPMQ